MPTTVLPANGSSAYNLSRSLRFRSSATAYLNRTPASASNRTTWTWSGWVKRGALGTGILIDVGGTTNNTDYQMLWFATDTIDFHQQTTTGYTARIVTNAVYRDPSAWYHIVAVWNTSSATTTLTGTPSDRMQLWVNGVQVTALNTTTVPAQNLNSRINLNALTTIGQAASGTAYSFDGYLAEVNFIDGQALTPSSFGAYNTTTGVWQPIKYTGTYGTNGFYLPFNENTTATYAGSFNGSNQYITIPSNANFAFGTGALTAECWFYTTAASTYQSLIDFWPNASGSYITGQWQLGTDNANHLTFFLATSSTSGGNLSITSSSTVLTNSWNHAAVVRNGTTATLYLNGVSVGTLSVGSNIIGYSSTTGSLGRQSTNSAYLNGYLSNARITNTAVYTSAFTPPSAPLTAITGTQLLTLQNSTLVDNSSNALSLTNNNSVTFPLEYPFNTGTSISNDQSGNGNNWTPNNISLVLGATYDSMTDVPTLTSATAANYCVMNPLSKKLITISNGNLQVDGATGSGQIVLASMALATSGKYYWEVTATNAFQSNIGVGTITSYNNGYMGYSGDGYYYPSGATYTNGSAGTTVSSYTNGDVIGIAFDATTGRIYYAKNGVWQNSGNPAAGTGYLGTLNGGQDWFPCSGSSGTSTFSHAVNLGQQPFTYTPPTGFVALNTYNLPTPTISNGANYFAATTYTATNSTQNIVNTTILQPDFVWAKRRNRAASNTLYDSVRGIGKPIFSDSTNAEYSDAGGTGLTSFNSNGFSVGSDTPSIGSINGLNGDTFVAWQWQAGKGSTSSNTNGSITSTVSVNATAGFSIVTYTGNGTVGATIGHGLGVAPAFTIFKNRTSGTPNWVNYHQALGATKAIYLNLTNVSAVDGVWNNTAPTSTVIRLDGSSSANVNTSGNNYVAYCWAEVAGFSKFGSYVGNASTDGPFVYCGFRPRFIMAKTADTFASDWHMIDTSRDPYNVTQNNLAANSNGIEYNGVNQYVDILSNGFKIRNSSGQWNNSATTIIYAAFAENPAKFALAR